MTDSRDDSQEMIVVEKNSYESLKASVESIAIWLAKPTESSGYYVAVPMEMWSQINSKMEKLQRDVRLAQDLRIEMFNDVRSAKELKKSIEDLEKKVSEIDSFLNGFVGYPKQSRLE